MALNSFYTSAAPPREVTNSTQKLRNLNGFLLFSWTLQDQLGVTRTDAVALAHCYWQRLRQEEKEEFKKQGKSLKQEVKENGRASYGPFGLPPWIWAEHKPKAVRVYESERFLGIGSDLSDVDHIMDICTC